MSPRCRTLTIVLVSLRRTLATSTYLSFAGEKTIGKFLVQSFVNVYIDLTI